ncbi:hypothetical protein NSK_006843 [Nannochloropsis salina CCMP1776]|jgi:hypothetical protein|uniref:Uncharacterized protein n=1 Tax=Nannochloropsis salina CCMP1776 TaxID=1027361 RepID=A0A4D9CQY6_9STRA|nr:hypothetical protein NSK_006843 [Nannochloropsis salina CCMP1776]|eukprot:TFJ81592.1 hypothetical protein NSK_006843 [Nannochloropsis salina CCMP1776]
MCYGKQGETEQDGKSGEEREEQMEEKETYDESYKTNAKVNSKVQRCDGTFRNALLVQGSKISERLRKIAPPRHSETRQARLLIKAVGLYLLWLKSEGTSIEGRCERIKITGKVAIDLYGAAAAETDEEEDEEEEEGKEKPGDRKDQKADIQGKLGVMGGKKGLYEECMQAANLCVANWRALESEAGLENKEERKGRVAGKTVALGAEQDPVIVAASKSVEVLLDLIWKKKKRAAGKTCADNLGVHAGVQEDGREGHGGNQEDGRILGTEAQEVTRLTILLLEIAAVMPKLMLKRALTVAADMGRRLVRQAGGVEGRSLRGCYQQARDTIVATLQALEPLFHRTSSTSGSNSSINSTDRDPPPPRWVLLTRASLLWLLSDCHSHLRDLDKALICLHELESLQQAHNASSSTTTAPLLISQPKLELAKVSYLLRGGTDEGMEAATAVVLRLVCLDVPAALQGAKALIAFQRYHPQAFSLFDALLSRLVRSPPTSSPDVEVAGAKARLDEKETMLQILSVLLEEASLLTIALQATSYTHPVSTYHALTSRLLSSLTPLLLPASPPSPFLSPVHTRSLPCSLSPSLLTEKDKASLRLVLEKALWHVHNQVYNTSPTLVKKNAREGAREIERAGELHLTQQLCDLLLVVTSPEDEEKRRSVLCTKSHAIWEEGGREEEAVAVAREACRITRYRSENARLNLFWLSTLMAMKGGGEEKEAGREEGKEREQAVKEQKTGMEKALVEILREFTIELEQGRDGGTKESKQDLLRALESMAKVVAETMMGRGEEGRKGGKEGGKVDRTVAARILKTILGEALRVWKDCYYHGGRAGGREGGREGKLRKRKSMTSVLAANATSSAAFPSPYLSPCAGTDPLQLCRTFLEAILSSYSPPVPPSHDAFSTSPSLADSSIPRSPSAHDKEGSEYPILSTPSKPVPLCFAPDTFSHVEAAAEIWSGVSTYALPILDYLHNTAPQHTSEERNVQQCSTDGGKVEESRAQRAAAMAAQADDLKWLTTLCLNFGVATAVPATETVHSASLLPSLSEVPPKNQLACSHDFFRAAHRFHEATFGPASLSYPSSPTSISPTTEEEKHGLLLLLLTVTSSLSSRSGTFSLLTPDESSYYLGQLHTAKTRISSSKTSALKPICHNLHQTIILLEILIRGSSTSSLQTPRPPSQPGSRPSSRPSSASGLATSTGNGSRGGEDKDKQVEDPTLGLPALISKETSTLLTFPFEVLHALARNCLQSSYVSVLPPSLRTSAVALFRLALQRQLQKHPSTTAKEDGGAEEWNEKALWVYLDLYHAVGGTKAGLEVVREFRAGIETKSVVPAPSCTLSRVASRLAAALYNEGVSKLEMMGGGEEGRESGPEVCLEAALGLLPWAEEDFKANYQEQIHSMLSVARELEEVEREDEKQRRMSMGTES